MDFADAAVHLASEQGFQLFLAAGVLARGAALIQSGQAEAGIAQLSKVLDSSRASGARLLLPTFFAALACGYGIARQVDKGFATLAEATALVESTGERDHEAELYRIKGELTLKRPGAGSNSEVQEEAETYFRQALEIARRQCSKSWELRATMSLARLLDQQGRREEARAMLAEIYGWFTEGFDTADLEDAKALFDQLNT